ncbi:MAG: ABC transporter substrate-binding protein [Albidovulum sp.]
MTDINSNTGALSRRGLLKGATALGAAGLILPASMRKASAEPKRGGTFRVAMGHGSTTDSLDPQTWENANSQTINTARCGYLTEIGPDGGLEPHLAESWEASADAVTWTFKLREGVTYHSGKPVTAEDVVASVNHHRGEDSKSAVKPIVDTISDIQADGMNVVVTLNAGNADFPFVMSDYHLPVLPSVDGKIDVTSKDGCGGYILDAWEPGVTAKFTRNPNHWRTDRGFFDAIEVYSIHDVTARQNALITGEVDVIDQVDTNTVALLQRSPGIKILSTTGTQHFVYTMDTRAAPFDNNHVRLALKYGINRQELVDKILGGYGSIGNDHPIGPSQRYHNAELEQHAYDPDKAKFHLKEAGLDSLSVQLAAADAAFSGSVDGALLFSESAAAAGITLEAVREPNDGYWDNVWMKKPFCASYWGGRPTEDWMFTTAYSAGAPWNESFWSNDRFNELLVAARSELDDDTRRGMYYEMQAICSNEGGTIVPMFASYVMAMSDKVMHEDTVAANWTLDGFRALERWWFA